MRAPAAIAVYLAVAFGSSRPVKLSTSVAVLAIADKDAIETGAIESNLEMLGVPFETTGKVGEAVRAPMVVVAGTLANATVSPADRERLYRFVESGGVLFATHVQGTEFYPMFGLSGFSATRANCRLRFAPAADPALRYINRPEERDIVFGDSKRYREFNWTTEYQTEGAAVLGRFPDYRAAFIRNNYGRGIAYALGLSFSDSTLRLSIGQSYEAEPQWANVFSPAGDVLRMLLLAAYEANVHPQLRIRTVPDGFTSALLLSHDIDARESFANSIAFAALEQKFGATSTFFATTKYFTDDTDAGYYTPRNAAWLREIFARGFDLGSHTVSHLKAFKSFPVGLPSVRFVNYRPQQAPTVFGEVLVSKELLERDVPGQRTVSFRAGELSHPPTLIEALETAGYLVDSTRAAGQTLTNYAYRPLRQAHPGAPVSSMIEVPVTLDDSMGYLTPATLDRAVANWIGIAEANAENENVTCLLIHPTDTTYKLAAEERLLQACRHKSFWIGSVGRFGLFARARAAVRVSAFANQDWLVLHLNQPRSQVPSGLSLSIEPANRWKTITVQDGAGEDIPFSSAGQADGRLLVLHP